MRSHLECHVEYQWIYITLKIYKESLQSWDQLLLHLKGTWHDANVSLDLIQLHLEILHLRNTKRLQFNATKASSEWLEQLRKIMPSWSLFTHLAFSVLALGSLMVIELYLLPHVVKCAFCSFLDICADFHHMWLKTAT